MNDTREDNSLVEGPQAWLGLLPAGRRCLGARPRPGSSPDDGLALFGSRSTVGCVGGEQHLREPQVMGSR